jgi:DNA-directed RNA polymerase subunit RPC12/RpoP
MARRLVHCLRGVLTMADRITFNCAKCGEPVVAKGNPPNDEDIISCTGCGHVFGPYAKVREAMLKAGKDVVSDMLRKTSRGLFKRK